MTEFEMKDLGKAKKILGMKMYKDKINEMLTISQKEYIEKMLQRFGLEKAKPISTPLAAHFKFSSSQCPTSESDKEKIAKYHTLA